MPGWHERTKDLVKAGDLQVYGIAPEQYGDRMALFLQWKQLDFPVLMDPLNVLGVKAVPISLLIDESGVIRYRNPKPQELESFLNTDYPVTQTRTALALEPCVGKALEALQSRDKEKVEDALLVCGLFYFSEGKADLTFQAGVLSRWLYDHGDKPEAFQAAVKYWSKALEEVPGQYIWRRRIQQYGPRLDKPYPFYNWVSEARREISARGEKAVKLAVEPSGSEVASPLRKLEQVNQSTDFPDPKNRLPSSNEFLVVTSTLIPHTDKPDQKRVHLQLSPREQAHWSSDAQEVELWYQPQKGEPRLVTKEASPLKSDRDVSSEARVLEADFSVSEKENGEFVLFYSLCETENAVCRFLKTTWKME